MEKMAGRDHAGGGGGGGDTAEAEGIFESSADFRNHVSGGNFLILTLSTRSLSVF